MRLRVLNRHRKRKKKLQKIANRIFKHNSVNPLIFFGLVGMVGISYANAGCRQEGHIEYHLQGEWNRGPQSFSCDEEGTYHSTTVLSYTPWAHTADVEYNFSNGTLVMGNKTTTANPSGGNWFGKGGYTGYVNAKFNAKEIFITGTLGSGNADRTGGGAGLWFNAENKLTVDGAKIEVNKAGTQNSTTSLGGREVEIRNSTIKLEGNLAGGGLNSVYIGNDRTEKVILNSTNLEFVSLSDVDFKTPQVIIKSQSDDSEINFNNITGKHGYLTFESGKDKYKTFSASYVDIEDFHVQSKDMNFHGTISKGSFKLGNADDTNFKADSIWITDNSTITANNIAVNNIELQGGANWDSSLNRTLTLNSKNGININELRNGDYQFGQVVGYTSTLNANNDLTIGKIMVRNFTGGSTIAVNVTEEGKTLNIKNISYGTDGVAGSSGRVELSSKGDVIVHDVTGCGNLCTGGLGIRPFNVLKISGKNFYGGSIEAIGLTTVWSDSTLDLSGVTDTTFIDSFYIRSGTLQADNFHINNFTVWKANANRLTAGTHPSDGSAYSVVRDSIGKSFINNLSMEIGTSHTADSAALWFKGGGDILNINYVAARPTSYINFGDIKQVNINELSAMEADIFMKTGIFNTITNKKGQTIITNGASKITANALNVNELLHLKDSSKHSGVMRIELNANGENIDQNFDKYLNVGIDSKIYELACLRDFIV